MVVRPLRTAALCLLLACSVVAFAPQHSTSQRPAATALAANKGPPSPEEKSAVSNVVATSALAVALAFGIVASPALADEYGRETEAPTMFTGENVMVGFIFGVCIGCAESISEFF